MALTKIITPELIDLPNNQLTTVNTDGVVLPKGITSNTVATTSECNYPTTATALYQLNSDGGVTNNVPDTCGSYDGTATSITYSTGNFGNAAVFNGSSSYITLPNSVEQPFILAQQFAVSIWFNIDALPTGGDEDFLISLYEEGYLDIRIKASGVIEAKVAEESSGTDRIVTSSSGVVSASTWHNVVWTGAANNLVLYVDSSSVATGSTWNGTFYHSNAGCSIGSKNNGTSDFFDGKIDQCRIFPSALTQSQVTQLYNETTVTDSTGRPASPVDGEFRYNSTTKKVEYYDGSNWYELTSSVIAPQSGTTTSCNYPTTATALYQFEGNANDTCGVYNATSVTDVTYSSTAPAQFGQYALAGSSPEIVTGITQDSNVPFTWSFWFYATAISGIDNIIAASNQINVGLEFNKIWLFTGGSNRGSGTSVSVNTWTHYAVTFDGSSGFVTYLNGSVAENITQTPPSFTSGDVKLLLNLYGTWGPFEGRFDQLRIFPSVLTATQVGYLFDETAP